MDVVTEEGPISVNTDGLCVESGFSVAKAEPEVRLFSSGFYVVVYMFFLQAIHSMTYGSENSHNNFVSTDRMFVLVNCYKGM
jgi:hypothetical protein